jgi:hypothetical protein
MQVLNSGKNGKVSYMQQEKMCRFALQIAGWDGSYRAWKLERVTKKQRICTITASYGLE